VQNFDYGSLRACKKIGLFDSGVGGLSVLRRLADLPQSGQAGASQLQSSPTKSRQFLYFGDTARCPYGDRTQAEITSFVTGIINWLTAGGAETIVMACNTSASVTLDLARRLTNVPILDLISPTAQQVASLGKKTGVLATSTTVRSKAFSKAIHASEPNLEVIEIACPDLVPIIESGKALEASTISVVQNYVEKLAKEKVEVLILGCTHFPFLMPILQELVDGRMLIVDPAQVLADLVFGDKRESATSECAGDTLNICVTGDLLDFARTAEICLGYDLGTIYSVGVTEVVGTTAPDSVSSLSQI
jgi:glutamate racemase